MPKIVLISGRKQSGKDTTADFLIESLGKQNIPCSRHFFADPLKDYCHKVLGLTYEQCYGTDADKNTVTKIRWADLPFREEKIVELYINCRHPDRKDQLQEWSFLNMVFLALKEQEVCLTGREVLQIFGSNICRRMNKQCFSNATLQRILSSQLHDEVHLVTDARFPDELEVFAPYNPVVVRLGRRINMSNEHESESALDGYDWQKFPKVVHIDNQHMSMEEKNRILTEQVCSLLMPVESPILQTST